MIGLSDIFRAYGARYLQKYGDRILPSHRKAIQDISQCRTESLGGQVWFCESCKEYHYSYHSCKNRHCPTCGNPQADEWIQQQKELLLPVIYFLVTFTLPEEFRSPARSHQKLFYTIFFRTSAQALQELALDPRFVGGEIGMIAVLQTWTRDLFYHPHIHYLIPGGGISPDGKKWLNPKEEFLMHYKPLSALFKGKFKAALRKTSLYHQIPQYVWKKEWGVHLDSVGNGKTAIKYLAPYIVRVAISNQNILNLDNGILTYRFKKSETAQYRTRRLPVLEFIRLFLQHVLPRGFVKVRYYGYLATKKRMMLSHVKELAGQLFDPKDEKTKTPKLLKCPKCGNLMTLMGEFSKLRGPPQYALPLQ
jgi:ribosomal protein S27AE